MTENLVLEHLKAIRSELGELKVQARETRERIGHLEEQNASMFRQYATLSGRIDHLADVVETIGKRLELVN